MPTVASKNAKTKKDQNSSTTNSEVLKKARGTDIYNLNKNLQKEEELDEIADDAANAVDDGDESDENEGVTDQEDNDNDEDNDKEDVDGEEDGEDEIKEGGDHDEDNYGNKSYEDCDFCPQIYAMHNNLDARKRQALQQINKLLGNSHTTGYKCLPGCSFNCCSTDPDAKRGITSRVLELDLPEVVKSSQALMTTDAKGNIRVNFDALITQIKDSHLPKSSKKTDTSIGLLWSVDQRYEFSSCGHAIEMNVALSTVVPYETTWKSILAEQVEFNTIADADAKKKKKGFVKFVKYLDGLSARKLFAFGKPVPVSDTGNNYYDGIFDSIELISHTGTSNPVPISVSIATQKPNQPSDVEWRSERNNFYISNDERHETGYILAPRDQLYEPVLLHNRVMPFCNKVRLIKWADVNFTGLLEHIRRIPDDDDELQEERAAEKEKDKQKENKRKAQKEEKESKEEDLDIDEDESNDNNNVDDADDADDSDEDENSEPIRTHELLLASTEKWLQVGKPVAHCPLAYFFTHHFYSLLDEKQKKHFRLARATHSGEDESATTGGAVNTPQDLYVYISAKGVALLKAKWIALKKDLARNSSLVCLSNGIRVGIRIEDPEWQRTTKMLRDSNTSAYLDKVNVNLRLRFNYTPFKRFQA
jgi:hypothetical protein